MLLLLLWPHWISGHFANLRWRWEWEKYLGLDLVVNSDSSALAIEEFAHSLVLIGLSDEIKCWFSWQPRLSYQGICPLRGLTGFKSCKKTVDVVDNLDSPATANKEFVLSLTLIGFKSAKKEHVDVVHIQDSTAWTTKEFIRSLGLEGRKLYWSNVGWESKQPPPLQILWHENNKYRKTYNRLSCKW